MLQVYRKSCSRFGSSDLLPYCFKNNATKYGLADSISALEEIGWKREKTKKNSENHPEFAVVDNFALVSVS